MAITACAWQQLRCVCPHFCVLWSTEWQKVVMRPVACVQVPHDRAAKLLRILSCVQKPQVCLGTIEMNVFYCHAIIIPRQKTHVCSQFTVRWGKWVGHSVIYTERWQRRACVYNALKTCVLHKINVKMCINTEGYVTLLVSWIRCILYHFFALWNLILLTVNIC